MEETKHRVGNVLGYKTKYKDGINYTLSITFSEEDEEGGLCLDVPEEKWNDLQSVIKILTDAEPDIYVEDPEQIKRDKEWEEHENKWHIKLLNKVEDISIQFNPFYWSCSMFFVTRPVNEKGLKMFKLCKGFRLGPITVTW